MALRVRLLRYCLAATACMQFGLPVGYCAGPLDAFNSAYTHSRAGQHQLELAVDMVNDAVDVLKIRNQTSYAGTNAGDYSGGHIKSGIGVTDRLWLEGSLWARNIQYKQDQFKLDSWQVAAQYRLNDPFASQLTWAIRLSSWGNASGAIQKSSSTTVSGVTFDTVSAIKPQDEQNQLDLIFSTTPGDNARVHGFVGIGQSKVSVEALQGVVNIGSNCRYDVRVDQQYLTGHLISSCTFGSGFFQLPSTIKLPVADIGMNPVADFNYTARYSHIGGSFELANYLNRFRIGMEYQMVDRGNLDLKIQKTSGAVVDNNLTVVSDYSRRMGDNWAVFLRGQLMWHQFAGDIPMAYNSFTSSRFNQKYGFVSTGVIFNLW